MAHSSTPRGPLRRLVPRALWLPRVRGLSELEAHVALVAGTYVARVVISVSAFTLCVHYLARSGATRTATGFSVGVIVLTVLAIVLAGTLGSVAWVWLRDLRANAMPGQPALMVGAVLDVLWLVLGFMATGSVALPFPPLLILAIGVHGVLLTAPLMAGLTAVAALCVAAAFAFIGALPDVSPSFGSTAQTAFLAGTGLVSAIVGNRIRAAGWAVDTLSRTIDRLSTSYHDALASLPVGLMLVDADGTVREANPAAFDLVWALPAMRSPQGANGVLASLTSADPALRRALQSATLASEAPDPRRWQGECRLANKAGSEAERVMRWVAWAVVPHLVPDTSHLQTSALAAPPGRAMGSIGAEDTPTIRVAMLVLTDVTDRLAATEMRQRADHFAAIAELSAGLAHEVRNPIAALQSAAEQLTDPAGLDTDDTRQLLRILGRESDRLNALVTEFLEFARVGGGAFGTHDVQRLIQDAVATVAQQPSVVEHGVRFSVQVPSLRLETDADLIYRVVSNLVLNAVHFSPPGGLVTVHGSAASRDAGLTLTVRDEGTGVPEALRDRIFRPFFTTRAQGSGLGLAIAARSASLLGGQLRCDGADGRPGASFTLQLPGRVASDPGLAETPRSSLPRHG
jgi:two-component system sensor histidine kinase PilS (NtrC family)